jgi:hypothetical protein
VLSECRSTQSDRYEVYRTVGFQRERLFILNDSRLNNYVLHLHAVKKFKRVANKAVTVETQETCRLCNLEPYLSLYNTIYNPPVSYISAGLSKVVLVNGCWYSYNV